MWGEHGEGRREVHMGRVEEEGRQRKKEEEVRNNG